jgi:predicted RNA binding protein YcfA (HicA-like mRNA interferase family)
VSPALPVVSGQEVVDALQRASFLSVGQKGSHVKLRDRDGRIVIVPLHRELARGTLSSILRQAGLSAEELIRLLKN